MSKPQDLLLLPQEYTVPLSGSYTFLLSCPSLLPFLPCAKPLEVKEKREQGPRSSHRLPAGWLSMRPHSSQMTDFTKPLFPLVDYSSPHRGRQPISVDYSTHGYNEEGQAFPLDQEIVRCWAGIGQGPLL